MIVTIGNPSVSVTIGGQSMTTSTGNPIIRDGSALPAYEGEYEITPRAHDEVVLPTAGKRMTDNVTVREVPYYEVSNESGKTVYIADTIND